MAPRLSALTFPTTGFDIIDASKKIEEETLPAYKPESYYPAQLGQILKDRYQIVGKLGYGGSSTVWLSRDLADSKHVVLKLCTNSTKQNREIEVYKHLETVRIDEPGKYIYRKLYESFEVEGPHGTHIYVQSRNMLLDIDDPKVFSVFEDAETQAPAPRKFLDDRTIYMSRRLLRTPRLPMITDFGEARITNGKDKLPWEDVMPEVYRAPEIILEMPWDNKIDIWGIGMMFWDLAVGRTLFKARNEERLLDDSIHLAEMIAIMGPPPKEFLERGKMGRFWWDENGNWRGASPIPDVSLEKLSEKMYGGEREGFLAFLRRILRWLPEERPTAEELVFDPWLMKGLYGEEEM
ncbi:predicted protein [Uncinocarpus reesii 1704]|uniref:non-specific serine/threonine protein kinase n=1 Tax=Uncinocarpus reesii (strain UAMH 1704) TaxID=336963 RepID=C4JKT7_UNCRE|nr:uncharacterized protein UREG_00633 [Uncinocarpus reesii 1704]EEP75786.1 predicted protein [Uncinocarpus reesii 1704]